MKVQIVNKSKHSLPKYETIGSAGMDLHANVPAPVIINPMERRLIPTGIRISLPVGYEAQIRPRSGLAIKRGITCLNTPGTIDSDYRGDVGVILINLSNEPFIVYDGDRIAQMVIKKYEQVEWTLVDELTESERGDGGFGHTGL